MMISRRLIASLAVCIALAHSEGWAQSPDAAPPAGKASSGATLHGGVLMGPSISNFVGPDAAGTDARFGVTLGGFVKYGRRDVALQAELLYVQDGATLGLGESASTTIKVEYVEIPLLLKFRNPIAGNGSDGAYRSLYLGPAVAMKIGSSLSVKSGGAATAVDIENASTGLLGFVFGADAIWNPGGRAEFVLDLRGSLGMSEVFEDAVPGTGQFVTASGLAPNVRNLGLTMMLGIGF